MEAEEKQASTTEERELDPYGSFPNMANRMPGLPGDVPSHEPGYVFHTIYVPVKEGPRTFTVRFKGLRATHGIISIRVHMVPADRSRQAKLVDSERIALDELAAGGGIARLSFAGYPGMHFALYGTIPGATDASAEAVTVTIDGDLPTENDPRQDREISAVLPAVRQVAAITSNAHPTLSNCTSQGYFAEPPTQLYRLWSERLGLREMTPIESWPLVFPLVALDQFGMLAAGVRMLSLGQLTDRLEATIGATGVDVTTAASLDHYSHRHFDVVCSLGIIDTFDDERAAYAWVSEALSSVSLGGLAIHGLLARPREGGIVDDRLALSTADLERWALNSIAHGQEVAELKPPLFGRETRDRPIPFAFIQKRSR